VSDALRPDEILSDGIRRIARKQIRAIRKELCEKRLRRQGGSIHDARKRVKMLRALLRLIRNGPGERSFRKENRVFRGIARALSQHRDVVVQLKTLDKLQRQHERVAAANDFFVLRRHLLKTRSEFLKGSFIRRKALKTELNAAMKRVKKWPENGLKRSDVRVGIKKTYERGRKAFVQAGQSRTTENLHGWRKRVKDLWHHLGMLQLLCPKTLTGLVDELERLGEYLGDDHDAAMLAEAAKRVNPRELEMLARMIVVHRVCLQRSAFQLGRHVYAEKPGAFARRIENCWTAPRGKS
jgi:CHAD domain-containing protein